MLPIQIIAQVKVVLNARQREDRAYRDVMGITPRTEMAEVERLADVHSRAAALTRHEETHLLTLVIRHVSASHKDLVEVASR